MSSNAIEIAIQIIDEQATAAFGNFYQTISNVSRNLSSAWDEFNQHLFHSNELMSTLIETAKYFVGVEFAKSIWDSATNLQRLENGLELVTGSAEGAKSEIAFLRETSDRLGVSFEAVSKGYLRMAASSKGTRMEGEQTRQLFLGMMEASTVLDMSAEQTANVLDALGNMMSKGRITAEDLRRRLGADLPGAMHLMAEAMGISTEQLNDMMKAGKLAADEVLPKLAALLHEKYGDAAVKASQDAISSFNRFKNALLELEETIASSGTLDAVVKGLKAITDKLKDPVLVGSMSNLISLFADMFSMLVGLIAKYGEWILGFVATTKAIGFVAGLANSFDTLYKIFTKIDLTQFAKGTQDASTAMGTLGGVAEGASTKVKLLNIAFSGLMAFLAGWAIQKIIDLGMAIKGLIDQYIAQRDIEQQSQVVREKTAQQLDDLSRRTGLHITTMKEFNALVKDGTLKWDEATHSYQLASNALADNAAKAQLASTYNEYLASELAKTEENAKVAATAIANIDKDGAFDGTIEGIGKIKSALDDLRKNLANGAEQTKSAFDEIGKTLNKMAGSDLVVFSNGLKEAFKQGAIAAGDFDRILVEVSVAAAKKLGIDIQQALTGVSKATRDLVGDLDVLAKDGSVPGQIIAEGFDKAIKSAKTFADMSYVTDELNAIKDSGKQTGDALDEAFRVVGKNAVDLFYKDLKAATDSYQVGQLKDNLEKLFNAGTIGAKQYYEALDDLNRKLEDVNYTQDMTHDELEAYRQEQQQVISSEQKRIDIETSAGKSIADYNSRMDDARQSNQNFQRALDDASGSQEEQSRLASEYVKKLSDEARQLDASARSEQARADAERRALDVLRQRLQAEQSKLAAMQASGTATQAELSMEAQLVSRLAASVTAAQIAVDAQQNVADAANQAASAMDKEAAKAVQVESSLQVLSQAQEYQANLPAVATGIDVAGTLAIKMRDMGAAMSEAASKAVGLGDSVQNFQDIFQRVMSSLDYSKISGIEKAIESLGPVFREIDSQIAGLTKSIYSNFSHSDIFSHVNDNITKGMNEIMQGQIDRLENIKILIKEFFDEARTAASLNEALDRLLKKTTMSMDQAKNILQNIGPDLKGQVSALQDWIARCQSAIDSAKYLDQQTLDNLKSGIDKAKEKLIELADQAKSAEQSLADIDKSLQQELWQQEGNQVAIENQRYQDQLDKLKELHDKAGVVGDSEYRDALDKARKLHDEKMAEIDKQHQQTMQNIKNEKAAASPVPPGVIPTIFAPGVSAPQPPGANTVPVSTPGSIFESFAASLAGKFVDKASALAATLNDKMAASSDTFTDRLKAALPAIATTGQVVSINLKMCDKTASLQASEKDYAHFLAILETAGMRAA